MSRNRDGMGSFVATTLVAVAAAVASGCGSPEVAEVRTRAPSPADTGATSPTSGTATSIAGTTLPIAAPESTAEPTLSSTTTSSIPTTVGPTASTSASSSSVPPRGTSTTQGLPMCGASDVAVTLTGAATSATIGQSMNVVVVATNTSGHVCQAIKAGGIEERNSSGNVVFGAQGGAQVLPGQRWEPGTSLQTPFTFTQPGPAGTYTLIGSWTGKSSSPVQVSVA